VNENNVIENETPFLDLRAACTTKTACTAKGGTCRKKRINCDGLYVQVAQGCSGNCQCCIPDCTTTTCTTSSCPTGFTLTNSQCLSFQTSPDTWNNAQLACQKLGGRLAKAKDTTTLATYIKANYAGESFWLGASDSITEGRCTGGICGLIYNFGDEDCMLWWGADDTGYIDEPCTESYNYICETDVTYA
ncbi:unnamed protein product, partial [Meganyctiphanes norvegica]